MMENRIVFFFLLAHFVFSVILYALFYFRVIHLPRRLVLLTILLPVWGGAMAWTAEMYTRKNKLGSQSDELPTFNESSLSSSSFFQPLFMEEEATPSVVPLEEALLLEDPAVRRNLMLEMIQENPQHYVPLLKKVGMGEDPEVSHYASTAMMQIQRKFELELQQREQRMRMYPADEESRRMYLDKLKEYIHTGLLADNALVAQRRKLNTLFVSLISETEAGRQMYADAIENLIELREFQAAESLLEDAEAKWENEEEFFLLKLKLYHKVQDGEHLKKAVEQIKQSGIYLSPQTRDIVDFWSSGMDQP